MTDGLTATSKGVWLPTLSLRRYISSFDFSISASRSNFRAECESQLVLKESAARENHG